MWLFCFGISFTGLQLSQENGDVISVRGILLDVTLDSPAKALWLQMKQYNGYFGRSKCKEKGCQHVIGVGKKGRNRQCHIYPYNTSLATGHGEVRRHDEVKQQALLAPGIERVDNAILPPGKLLSSG